jgi:hypothetical protein
MSDTTYPVTLHNRIPDIVRWLNTQPPIGTRGEPASWGRTNGWYANGSENDDDMRRRLSTYGDFGGQTIPRGGWVSGGAFGDSGAYPPGLLGSSR